MLPLRLFLRRLCSRERLSFAQSFAASWTSLLVVQILIAWGRWSARDMTGGDTSYYYQSARQWLETGDWSKLAFSPIYDLYLVFWTSLADHPFWVIHLHRLGIYALEGAAILFLLRRLLPRQPLAAWLGALAWIINPASLDSLYEVHLFSLALLLPILACFAMPSSKWRAAACGFLLVVSLFVRNEYALFLAAALVFPCRQDLFNRVWKPYLVSLGLATATALALIALLTHGRMEPWLQSNRAKTELQFGQGYAVYYSQVHPDWNFNPFLAYKQVNQEVFGVENIGMGGALARNPQAVLDFAFHNLKQFGHGLQLLWFDRTSSTHMPSGAPTPSPAPWVWLPFAILLFFSGTGAWALLSAPSSSEKSAGLVFMAALPLALLTTILQRATPIYMLPLGPLTCFLSVLGWRHWKTTKPRLGLAAALILALAFGWVCRPCWLTRTQDRPLAHMVNSLWPSRSAAQDPAFRLGARGYWEDTLRYLHAKPEGKAVPAPPGEEWSDKTLWIHYFETTPANWFYADQVLMRTALPQAMEELAKEQRWELVSKDKTRKVRWSVYKRCLPQETP